MCGIAGFIGKGNKEILQAMTNAIKYRGPDDRGFFIKDNVGLAHCRLSIIDLSPAGHQPMSNLQGTIWIVFNGEIYNFQELREELIKKGKYKFRSQTDTEVIIYLYEEYGEEAFSKLNGMFALAIYDFRCGKLILARDRMGKKPLYWGVFGGTFIFGSELKAVLAHPAAKKEIDLSSLKKYLMFEYIPTPHSVFKGIHKLEPATFLVWQNSSTRKQKFWSCAFGQEQISFQEALKELDRQIDVSVRRRLIADVPLGIFLSGGLDSSTIAYYAQKNSISKIKTFSIGFEEKSFDESKYAEKAAKFLETEHYCEILSNKKCLAVLPEIMEKLDEPLADPSIIPTYLLSSFTKQRVTVALGGDGGDELFAGYPTFQAQFFADFYKKIPDFFRKGIEKLIKLMPAGNRNFSLDFKLRKFIDAANDNPNYRHQNWLGAFNSHERQKLFKKDIWKSLEPVNEYEDIDNYVNQSEDDLYNRILFLYLRTYLMDDVLVKVDRASMYNALEVRAPFLDFELVEFACNLPYSYKCRNLRTKFILKQLMKDKLPKGIVFRSKKGFGIPLARWLRGELKEFCNEVLSEKNINQEGIFDYGYIRQLKEEHFSSKKNNHKQLWTLMVWQMWRDKWAK